MKVLITGAAGVIGQAVVKELLERGHKLIGLDLEAADKVHEAHAGDLAQPGVVEKASAGADAVIHLAANPEDGDLLEDLLHPNIIGLHRVIEATAKHRIGRLVVASSMQVVSGYEGAAPVHETVRAPRNPYALTKYWAEAYAEMAAHVHSMQVLVARIGWLPRTQKRKQMLEQSDSEDIYLSDADAGRFFACCVDAELPSAPFFQTLYAVGKAPKQPRINPETARQLIGYEPQDTFPEGYDPESKY
jgi:uronate dehydrogenase